MWQSSLMSTKPLIKRLKLTDQWWSNIKSSTLKQQHSFLCIQPWSSQPPATSTLPPICWHVLKMKHTHMHMHVISFFTMEIESLEKYCHDANLNRKPFTLNLSCVGHISESGLILATLKTSFCQFWTHFRILPKTLFEWFTLKDQKTCLEKIGLQRRSTS